MNAATDTPPMAKRKAYSYVRFSTPEQRLGDSKRRQLDMARLYAERNDLDLDTELTFLDEGISAYRGRNADAGQLGAFRECVKAGLVPQGSILLIEQLDRLSRMTPYRAKELSWKLENLPVRDIKIDRRFQMRVAGTDPKHVQRLIVELNAMGDGETIEPVMVGRMGKLLYLLDGFHRIGLLDHDVEYPHGYKAYRDDVDEEYALEEQETLSCIDATNSIWKFESNYHNMNESDQRTLLETARGIIAALENGKRPVRETKAHAEAVLDI